MYKKDGKSYYIVDSHIHFWTAAGEPAQRPRQAVHRLLLRLPPQPSRRSRRCGRYEKYALHRRAADEGPVRATATSTTRSSSRPSSNDFYLNGFGQTEEASRPEPRHPDKLTYNHNFDPRNGEAGSTAPRGRRAVGPARASSSTPPSGTATPAATSSTTRGLPVPRGVPQAGHQEHPRAQGPDDPPAGPGRLRRRRHRQGGHRLHRPELHRRARRPAAAGGLLLDRHPGAQRLRRSRGGDAVHPHPAPLLRPDHRRAALLDRRGPDPVLQRLRALDAEVARSRSSSTSRSPRTCTASTPPITAEQKQKILGPERRGAVRHRRAGGTAAAEPAGREGVEVGGGAAGDGVST